MADKIIFLRRLDVTATERELLTGDIKRGESALTVMNDLNGLYGYARILFDYRKGGGFNYKNKDYD